ncbi:MAG: tRNA preQ1(34) S-adenosylmethionine ribosyltransferase-isomerase QueA [Firmicutes bacterium]|nr:tRNA preQ1(34) S-adenosylmethionine ribosyltransferase-isomerase QueA [Bacillota bacterium]
MDIADFDYDLPPELIAQEPLADRSASRLMVLHRDTGAIEHRIFRELPEMLRPEDVLVINDTRVMPARIFGHKLASGGRSEFLLLRPLEERLWEALARPAKRVRKGTEIAFTDRLGQLMATAEVIAEEDEGIRHLRFAGERPVEELLSQIGQIPLPPYIHRTLPDPQRYQTVYARRLGSAAAPTAGLHFTPELLDAIAARGVAIVPITLHVGLGTFRPVTEMQVEAHQMHEEWYEISKEAAAMIRSRKASGGRIVAVGTTTVRTLESVASRYDGEVRADSGWSSLYIYPGFRYRAVDAIVTNFHLPKSTLLLMIAAFAGRDHVLQAYQEAVKHRYRFYSFGDAMFIV